VVAVSLKKKKLPPDAGYLESAGALPDNKPQLFDEESHGVRPRLENRDWY
jgi:hypothetical protein